MYCEFDAKSDNESTRKYPGLKLSKVYFWHGSFTLTQLHSECCTGNNLQLKWEKWLFERQAVCAPVDRSQCWSVGGEQCGHLPGPTADSRIGVTSHLTGAVGPLDLPEDSWPDAFGCLLLGQPQALSFVLLSSESYWPVPVTATPPPRPSLMDYALRAAV